MSELGKEGLDGKVALVTGGRAVVSGERSPCSSSGMIRSPFLSGTSAPSTRNIGGRPDFRWMSDAPPLIATFRISFSSMVLSLESPRRGSENPPGAVLVRPPVSTVSGASLSGPGRRRPATAGPGEARVECAALDTSIRNRKRKRGRGGSLDPARPPPFPGPGRDARAAAGPQSAPSAGASASPPASTAPSSAAERSPTGTGSFRPLAA